jgi:hypothetical protein
MLFRETVAVYCENHTEHINTLCGQNAEFLYVKGGGVHSDQCVLKGYIPFVFQTGKRTLLHAEVCLELP